MLNAEKFKDEILDGELGAFQKAIIIYGHNVVEGFTYDKLMQWLLSEYKEPILDEVEREYLSAICKPYEVVHISKIPNHNESKCYICVKVKNTASDAVYESIQLPFFYTLCLYTKMELKKQYTPQELGIKCKNNPNGEIKHENS